jgi:arylsulfatase A-like enzyme
VCQNSKEFNAGARDIDDDEWDAIRGLYDAEIAHIDDQLTRLFDWLKAEGEWESTTVIVCADHGELHGEHDLYGHEFCLYDPLINVPLLVKHPDLAAGRCDDLVELLDLYHTVLDATGVEGGTPAAAGERAVARDRTRSLLSADYRAFDDVADPDPGQRAGADHAYVEYSRPVVELAQLEEKAAAAGLSIPEESRFYARMRAARSPVAKYVRIDRTPDEAFRLDRDPGEREDVAASITPTAGVGARADGGEVDTDDAGDADPIVAAERALARFEAGAGGAWTGDDDGEVSDGSVADMDAEMQERLRDLGYLE